MTYRQPLSLNAEQQAVIRTAAAEIQPCWRERFLMSVQDHLLWPDRDRAISDADVIAAIEGVKWTMFVGTVVDDD